MRKPIAVLAGAVLIVAGGYLAALAAPAPVTVRLESRSGSQVSGTLTLTEPVEGQVKLSGELGGHTSGPKGFHIHEKGDCSAPDAMSAGGHFNPDGHKHGGPAGNERHAGDLGNLVFDSNGKAKVEITVQGVTLQPGKPNSLLGRSIVVHAQIDDLVTDPSGNSGARVACGVIQL